MDTSGLMSSLREMVKAEAMVTLLDSGAVVADIATKEQWRLHYSKHETVVRNELAKLGDQAEAGARAYAGNFARLGGNRLG